MKRKIFALLLAVLLVGNLSLSATADAYIPPEEEVVVGFDMSRAFMKNGTCKALNTYLSNFVEVGLQEYASSDPEDSVIPAVLKHLELNSGYYPKYVKKSTGEDGKPYMRIAGSFFEERAEHLFGKNLSAKDCPGYEDGYIVVSADHFGGPIQVFGSVYDCYHMEGDIYKVYFEAFRIDKDFSGWYSTAHSNLPTEKLTSLGYGHALVRYAGGKTNSNISTSDFSLAEFSMDAEGIPCQGANLPYGYVEPTEPPTEPPTEAPTEAETEAPTNAPAETEPEKPTLRNEKDDEEEEAFESADDTPININNVLIIILVVAVALLALLLIVILLIRKKHSR